jgi:hypothetical protein
LRTVSLPNSDAPSLNLTIDSCEKSIRRTGEQATLVSVDENSISELMFTDEWNEIDCDSPLHYPALSSLLSFDVPSDGIDLQCKETDETMNTSSDRHAVSELEAAERRNSHDLCFSLTDCIRYRFLRFKHTTTRLSSE